MCAGRVPVATSCADTGQLWHHQLSAVAPEPVPLHLSTACLPKRLSLHHRPPWVLPSPPSRELRLPIDSLQVVLCHRSLLRALLSGSKACMSTNTLGTSYSVLCSLKMCIRWPSVAVCPEGSGGITHLLFACRLGRSGRALWPSRKQGVPLCHEARSPQARSDRHPQSACFVLVKERASIIDIKDDMRSS